MFNFEEEKAINALLYICSQMGGSCNKYLLLKILYFAEQKHLVEWGRPITGDGIIAMEYGPVPSLTYDMVKNTGSGGPLVEAVKNEITACAAPNIDHLSESDIECLDEAIKENRSLNFGQLKDKSHDLAYNKAIETWGLNSSISLLDIATAGGADAGTLEYIRHNYETINCVLHAPTAG